MKNKIVLILIALIILIFSCKKEELTIKIPLVTWGGYAALFAANNGAEAKEDSLFYKYGNFKVELVQVEDPSLHLQGFSNGTYQIIWSTVDMLPLQYDSLSKDPKTSPKIIGVFDISAGGDGIIVRNNIKKPEDFIGKTIVVPQYQPSHYFMLWYLDKNNIDLKSVKFVYAEDAIKAKDTYINDKNIDVCVTWSPFIYDITDKNKPTYVRGSELYLTTAVGSEAHGIITDVYVARSDFVKNNPKAVKAFTKAMIEGYEIYLKDKEKIAGQIASLFGISGGSSEVMKMFDDVVIAGKEENRNFFNADYQNSGKDILELSTRLYIKDTKLPETFKINTSDILESKFMLEAVK